MRGTVAGVGVCGQTACGQTACGQIGYGQTAYGQMACGKAGAVQFMQEVHPYMQARFLKEQL